MPTPGTSLELRGTIATLHGVSDVQFDAAEERITVAFVDGTTAVVERDPLAVWSGRDSYIMRLSATVSGEPGKVV